jgi:hypothetical protein
VQRPVAGGDEIRAKTLVLVDNREPIAPEKRDVAARDMLFSLQDISCRFGEIVQAWFTRSTVSRPLYDLYFGTLRSPFMFVEHRFLNMFQALESYDRRTRVMPFDKVEAHEERLDHVTNRAIFARLRRKNRYFLTKKTQFRRPTSNCGRSGSPRERRRRKS